VRRGTSFAAAGVLFVLAILAWQFWVTAFHVPHYILPGPARVVADLWRERALFAGNVTVTVFETLAGLAGGIACGAAAALIVHRWVLARRALYPWLVASQTIPIIIIAPILTFWFGYGLLPKVLVAGLFAFFPVTVGLLDGLRGVDREYVEVLRTLGAGEATLFRHVLLPGALPSFFSGLRLAAAYSVIGAITGEWVGSAAGLGYVALRARTQFLTDRMFASVVVTAVIGIALFLLVGRLERRLTPWRFSPGTRRETSGKDV